MGGVQGAAMLSQRYLCPSEHPCVPRCVSCAGLAGALQSAGGEGTLPAPAKL
jgi:hypothetical protein